jgi:hypothetical protein
MAPETDTLEVVVEPAGDHFDVAVPDDIAALFQGKSERALNPDGTARQIEKKAEPAVATVAEAGGKAAVETKPEPKRKMSTARAAQVARAQKIEEAANRAKVRQRTTDTRVPMPAVPEKRRNEVLSKFEEVAGAGDLKAAGLLLLEEGDRRAFEQSQLAVIADRDARIQRQETRAQEKWSDWDQKLRSAGVFAGCQKLGYNADGSVRYANQEMGEAVYSEDNPAEAAYELATTILKIRSGESLEDEIEESLQEKPAAAPKTVVAAAAAPVAAVAHNEITEAAESARPKGIGNLGSAGSPRMSFSRADLDQLMEVNPGAYMKLVEANKSLGDWHMGRTE